MPIRVSKETEYKLTVLKSSENRDILNLIITIGEDPTRFLENEDLSRINLTESSLNGISFQGCILDGAYINYDQIDEVFRANIVSCKRMILFSPNIYISSVAHIPLLDRRIFNLIRTAITLVPLNQRSEVVARLLTGFGLSEESIIDYIPQNRDIDEDQKLVYEGERLIDVSIRDIYKYSNIYIQAILFGLGYIMGIREIDSKLREYIINNSDLLRTPEFGVPSKMGFKQWMKCLDIEYDAYMGTNGNMVIEVDKMNCMGSRTQMEIQLPL